MKSLFFNSSNLGFSADFFFDIFPLGSGSITTVNFKYIIYDRFVKFQIEVNKTSIMASSQEKETADILKCQVFRLCPPPHSLFLG